MITIKDISKRFGKLQVLRQIDLDLRSGECIALIGPNGCGKTTLIKSILNMVLPDQGSIHFNGKDIRNNDEYRKDIGYMPQIGRYPENMTIEQLIGMVKSIRSADASVDNWLYEQFGLASMLSKKMRTLSGGTTQKVSATLAFLFHPRVLILDEPTAGLDPLSAEVLKEKIIDARKKGCLILITSHLLSELEDLVSQVIFMQEGSVIFHKDVNALKATTEQDSIARAISWVLRNEKINMNG